MIPTCGKNDADTTTLQDRTANFQEHLVEPEAAFVERRAVFAHKIDL